MNSGKIPIGILEAPLFPHVGGRQVVERVDLARVADAERHAEIPELRVLAARHEPPQRLDRVDRLPPSLDLAAREVGRDRCRRSPAGDEIEVGEVALVADRAPGAGDASRATPE